MCSLLRVVCLLVVSYSLVVACGDNCVLFVDCWLLSASCLLVVACCVGGVLRVACWMFVVCRWLLRVVCGLLCFAKS